MRSSLGKVTVPFSMQIDIGVQKYLVAVEWIGIAHSCCENPVTWIPSMDDITACDQVHANRLRPRSKPSPIGPTETTSAGRKPLQKSAKQKITQLRPNKHSVQLWALPLGNACYSSAIEAAISSGLWQQWQHLLLPWNMLTGWIQLEERILCCFHYHRHFSHDTTMQRVSN